MAIKINALTLANPQNSMQLETDIAGEFSNKITLADLKSFFNSTTLLQNLSNINLTGLSDNDILVYDINSQKFVNQEFPVVSNSLSNLTDTDIDNLLDNQFLVYDLATSTWKNETISFSTSLSDLTDVLLTGLTDNDIIIYNASQQRFVNIPLPDFATALNQLTDVNITDLQNNDILIANNNVFENSNALTIAQADIIDNADAINLIEQDVTDLETDISNLELNSLTDVTITSPTNGQIVIYDSNISTFTNQNIPAIPVNLNDLSDVTITSLQNNDILIANNNTFENSNALTIAQADIVENTTNIGINEGNITNLQLQVDNLELNDLSDVVITSLQVNDILVSDSTGNFINSDIIGDITLDISNLESDVLDLQNDVNNLELNDLNDVTITTPVNNQFMRYNGSTWVNETVSLTTTFNDLTDTNFGAFFTLTNGDLVTYNAATSEWVNAPVNQIVDVPETLNDLDDVNITSLSAGQVLLSDGFDEFNNTTLVTTTLTNIDDGSVVNNQILRYVTANTNYEPIDLNLNALDDVNIGAPSNNDFMLYNSSSLNFEAVQYDIDTIGGVSVSGVTENQVLQYNASGVLVNQFLPFGDLSGVTLSGAVDDDVIIYNTGAYRNQPISSYIPPIPSDLSDLDNVIITTPTNNDVLTYDTGNWVNQSLPAIPEQLNDLSDVQVTSPQGGELFVYSGANTRWQNGVIGLNQLSNVSITSPVLNQILKLTNTSPQTFTNTFVDITELSGVDITSPVSGDYLIYNDSTSNFENAQLELKKDEWALYGFGSVNKGSEVISTPGNFFYNPALNRILAQDVDDPNNFPVFLNPSPSLNGDTAGSNGGGYYVEIQADGYYDLTGYAAGDRSGGVGDFGAVFLQFLVTNELGDALFFETSGMDFDRLCNARLYATGLYLKAGYRVRFLIRYVDTNEFWRYGQIDIMSSNSNTFLNAKDMSLQNDETSYGTSFKVTKRNSIKSEGGKLPITMDTLISIGANNSGSLNNDFAVAGFADTVQYVEQWSYTSTIRDVYRMNTGGGSISANYMMYIDNDMRIYSSGRYDDGANGQNGVSSDTFVDITSSNQLIKPFRVLPKVRDGMFNNLAIGEFCSFLLVRDNNNSIAVCGLRQNGRLLGISDGANVDTFTRYSGSGVSNALTISCSRRAQVWINGTRSGQTGLPYAAGSNEFGATGNGSTSGSKNPGTIGFFLQNVWGVVSGLNFSIYLLTGGTMQGFGQDANGQLAQGGTSIARANPVTLTDTSGSNVGNAVFVACGSQHTMVIRDDFTLWSCGRGVLGATGLGTSANATRLTDTGLTQIQRVFCGANCTAAIDFEGRLYFTGANNGEVDIGSVIAGTVTYDFVEITLPTNAQAKSVHFFGDLTRFGMHVVISDNLIGEQVIEFNPN